MAADDAMTAHELVMEPLCGVPTALEVAKHYIECIHRRAPRYNQQLSRALEELDMALKGVRDCQGRAVELWRNNYDRTSG